MFKTGFSFYQIILIVFFLLSVFPASVAVYGQQIDYRVDAGDTITITVYDEADLSQRGIPVPDNGIISMPLIGDIHVSGMSTKNIEKQISQRLANGYLLSPEVTVSVVEYRPFFLVGEVKNPGRQLFANNVDVRKAIVLAGGLTELGDKQSILIERANSGRQNKADESTLVEPGDIITIGALSTIDVFGSVEKPGPIVLSEKITVSRAITLAGGFEDNANLQDVKLERGNKIVDVSSMINKIIVAADDVIRVGKAAVVLEADKQYFYMKGEIGRPGKYEYSLGLTVDKAIAEAGGFSARASKRKISLTREGDPPIQLKRVILTTPVIPGDIITVGTSLF